MKKEQIERLKQIIKNEKKQNRQLGESSGAHEARMLGRKFSTLVPKYTIEQKENYYCKLIVERDEFIEEINEVLYTMKIKEYFYEKFCNNDRKFFEKYKCYDLNMLEFVNPQMFYPISTLSMNQRYNLDGADEKMMAPEIPKSQLYELLYTMIHIVGILNAKIEELEKMIEP